MENISELIRNISKAKPKYIQDYSNFNEEKDY